MESVHLQRTRFSLLYSYVPCFVFRIAMLIYAYLVAHLNHRPASNSERTGGDDLSAGMG